MRVLALYRGLKEAFESLVIAQDWVEQARRMGDREELAREQQHLQERMTETIWYAQELASVLEAERESLRTLATCPILLEEPQLSLPEHHGSGLLLQALLDAIQTAVYLVNNALIDHALNVATTPLDYQRLDANLATASLLARRLASTLTQLQVS